jgi:hypothetical protein
MYVVGRKVDDEGSPLGEVIELASVSRLVQLVPRVDSDELHDFNVANSLSKCDSFYLNSFADKEIYQAVY